MRGALPQLSMCKFSANNSLKQVTMLMPNLQFSVSNCAIFGLINIFLHIWIYKIHVYTVYTYTCILYCICKLHLSLWVADSNKVPKGPIQNWFIAMFVSKKTPSSLELTTEQTWQQKQTKIKMFYWKWSFAALKCVKSSRITLWLPESIHNKRYWSAGSLGTKYEDILHSTAHI